ncbi:hypothetical protein FRACYDRAFT_247281 [Fragilariopsis cylindrus CCMP1102]|uniref:Uncharacterized protein n=1 Tax=Fragilariopsis cylindrus CCMP1102 TaxID=635003 RepID=A0A1E7EWU1_9STRA|nr:hypothetical protein FRACYDRAFT_247281 [Fragilariopsis cylindrus CCMP1102]|eukprot:OEU10317.1 hypothetical protein FRACYDRAFT_247281 [Fragilariopsis cylindrus CCMP1102]
MNNNNNKTTVAPPTSSAQVPGKSGRPIGTTNKAMQDLTRKFSQMKNDIALSWVDNKLLPPDHTNKMSLKQLIANKQHEYQLDPDIYSVASTTIYSRICRDRLEVKGTGMTSPMLDAEPLIVMYIKQSTDCNDTMNKRQIIDYANSNVSGTPVEDDVIAWKLRHQVDLREQYIKHGIKPTSANLGNGWFRGFVRRWGNEIQYKGSSNVDFYRTEHCTYEKFEEMYDNVYGLLVKWGYAEVLDEPLYYNRNGEVCDIDDPNQYGEPVHHRFKHPELFMAADECGTNTNMSKDKMSAGNRKHCSTKGVTAKLPACTSDCHFTTMVWTKLDGNPAVCLVIIEKDGELSYSELHGLDVNAIWIGDDTMFNEIKNMNNDNDKEKKMKEMLADTVFSVELLQLNTGPGKVFPGGPICIVNGIKVPTLVRRSASGGITPEILVDVLRLYDSLIPRAPGDP